MDKINLFKGDETTLFGSTRKIRSFGLFEDYRLKLEVPDSFFHCLFECRGLQQIYLQCAKMKPAILLRGLAWSSSSRSLVAVYLGVDSRQILGLIQGLKFNSTIRKLQAAPKTRKEDPMAGYFYFQIKPVAYLFFSYIANPQDII